MTPTTPPLATGERYIGAIVSAEGVTTQIILLPGQAEKADWQTQMDWAKSIGGDLPNRVEQALLYATAPEEFEPYAYWSNTPHASGYAWYQNFDIGYQDVYDAYGKLRARAVRRLIIQ